MNFSFVIRFLIVSVLLLTSLLAHSTEERYSDRLEGSAITTNATIEVIDDKYPLMQSNPLWGDDFTNHVVKNKVWLGLNPSAQLTADVEATVEIDIDYRLDDGTIQSTTATLTAEYLIDGTLSIQDKQSFLFEDGHVVQVEVTSVSVTGGSINDFILQAEIEVERYYSFDGSSPTSSGIEALSGNYLEFYWSHVDGAEYYEVEYVHINDYTLESSVYKPASILGYDFYKNSTRVITQNLHYVLPQVFGHGYVLFRVRGIGLHGTNFDLRKEGNWNLSTSGIVSAVSASNKLAITTEYEASKNWSYQSVMTEQGKRMEGVSYVDGLGRPRQQLMHNTETNQVVVSNTYYDYHGRPVIQDLGTPVDDEELKHYAGFNRSAVDQEPYGPEHFDEEHTSPSCPEPSDAFDENYGAGKYYSDQNPLNADKENRYIPDAEGYPYAQIQYMPDQTGRIKRAGAYGDEHQIGQDHESKFIYSTPSQEELNRLFGSEVGYNYQYQKRLMQDANGQLYVTYYDLAGRVVASGMAGEAPQGLTTLADSDPANDFEQTLINGSALSNIQLSWSKPEEITSDGAYVFSYDFTPEEYTDACMDEGVCFDCVYDLILLITDGECPDVTPYFADTIQINGEDLDGLCSSATYSLDTTIMLDKGSYHITRILSVNQAAIDEYWCLYLEDNTCVDDYSTIYNTLYDQNSFGDCILPSFDLSGLGAIPDSAYSCTYYEYMMKTHLAPEGQYALYDVDGNGQVDASAYPLSIFNPSNDLPTGGTWDTPTTPYLDSDGNPAVVAVEYIGGGDFDPAVKSTVTPTVPHPTLPNFYLVAPEDLENAIDFIDLLEPSWLDALLPFHPEYCYLTFCWTNTDSEDYDNELLSVSSLSEACAGGYFNPLDLTYAQAEAINTGIFYYCFNENTSIVEDPFFATNGGGEGYYDSIKAAMSNYINLGTLYPTDVDIWTYAVYLTIFTGEDWDDVRLDVQKQRHAPCYDDLIWLTYRELYLGLKQKYYQLALLDHVMENDCYNGCFGVGLSNFDPSVDITLQGIHHFDDYDPIDGPAYDPSASTDQPCHASTVDDYADKQPVFGGFWEMYAYSGNPSSAQTDLEDLMIEQCEQSCEQNAELWMASLYECASITTQELEDIKAELIELCQMGCEGTTNYPNGVSSLLTGQTVNGNSSFEEILADVLGSTYEDDFCSIYLFPNLPPAQGDSLVIEATVYLDDCGCDELMQARYDFDEMSTAMTLPEGVENAEDMLYYNTGIQVDDIDFWLCKCDEYFPELEWTEPGEWTTQATEDLLEDSIAVPFDLACKNPYEKNCVTCTELDNINTAFESYFSTLGVTAITDSENYEQLLANYFNDTLGFHLDAQSYLDFMAGCNAATEEPYCTLNPNIINWMEVMDVLAKKGELLAQSTTPVDLYADNIAYAYGGLSEELEAPYYWACEGMDCDSETLTVYFGENTSSSCSFTLDFPSGFDTDFSQIVGFSDLRMLDNDCGSASDFELMVHYLDCGELQQVLVTGTTDCMEVSSCVCGDTGQELCDALVGQSILQEAPCYSEALAQIASQAMEIYTQQLDDLYTEFSENYTAHCTSAFTTELFTYTGNYQMYQFTLFFYDQAGNLTKTIAPEGVDYLSAASNTTINTARAAVTGYDDQVTSGVFPDHEFITQYHYNSYGQLTATSNPDQEGETEYFYDRYGRIVASQNPEQADQDIYSYTYYDEQGRPWQVGQVEQSTTLSSAILKADDLGSAFQTWVENGDRTEVTISIYDEPLSGTIESKFRAGEQQNVNLRVASILYFDEFDGTTTLATDYTTATHYSYDPHGNVIETLQDVPMMAVVEQDIKSTQYDFELISGNMKAVHYQKDSLDGYSHFYHYDQLNRLKEVQTTTDKDVHRATEAVYQYYDYGPLSRVEIGEHQVQGIDYAYTINGWIKGVNSNTLVRARDMGMDATTGFDPQNTNVHTAFAKDVFGFTLSYFDGDYTSIGTSSFEATHSSTNFGNGSADLFNGNIRHMVTAIQGLDIQGYAYEYDQLQRLKEMQVYRDNNLVTNNNWSTSASTNDYLTQISYDKNGNIDTLVRNGYGAAQLAMDDMRYTYHMIGTDKSNRLSYVNDVAPDYGPYEDIKQGQTSVNYHYNKIGELIEDEQEAMTLEWRYGDHKLSKIYRGTNLTTPQLEFVYNPLGVRVAKIKRTENDGTVLALDEQTVTYYAYDANGQVMAVYESLLYHEDGETTLEEQYIYGSSRVGVIKQNKTVYFDGLELEFASDYRSNTLGQKRYEMTSHLGTVNMTVSDRKIWNNTDSHYEAVVTMYAETYSFGMIMPNRSFNADESRYGYQGSEKTDEIYGEGNAIDFGARIYDPRLGRWMSRDPLEVLQPDQSPYKAFLNNPIIYVDPEGETEYLKIVYKDESTGESMTLKVALSPDLDPSHLWSDGFVRYHDYSTTLTITKGKDGNINSSYSSAREWEYGGNSPRVKLLFGIGGVPLAKAMLSDQPGGYYMTSKNGMGTVFKSKNNPKYIGNIDDIVTAFGALQKLGTIKDVATGKKHGLDALDELIFEQILDAFLPIVVEEAQELIKNDSGQGSAGTGNTETGVGDTPNMGEGNEVQPDSITVKEKAVWHNNQGRHEQEVEKKIPNPNKSKSQPRY